MVNAGKGRYTNRLMDPNHGETSSVFFVGQKYPRGVIHRPLHLERLTKLSDLKSELPRRFGGKMG